MKRCLSVFLVVLMVVSLVGPLSALADQSGYDLVFWVYSDWTSGKQGELFNKWADAFVKANPQVKSITMIGKNDNDLLTGIMAGVGLPDCYSASFRDGKKYYESVKLLDLKPYYDATDDAYKNGWIPEAIETVQLDGGMWALPFMSYIPIIFRNLDVLKACGIDPAQGTPTWDAFVEQCKIVTEKGYTATHKWSGDWYTAGGIMASEPTLTPGYENGATTVKAEQLVPTFNVIKALAPYCSTLTRNDDAAREALKTNKEAFMIDGPWNVEGYDASGVNYDIVALPAFTEGGKNGGMKGWDAVYAIDSGDEARNELIAKWLIYITSYEQQKEFTSYVGRPVLRSDVMNDPETQTLPVAKVSATAQLGGIKQMDFFKSSVFWPSVIADISEEVAQGTLSPEDASTKMVGAINALYAEAGE